MKVRLVLDFGKRKPGELVSFSTLEVTEASEGHSVVRDCRYYMKPTTYPELGDDGVMTVELEVVRSELMK